MSSDKKYKQLVVLCQNEEQRQEMHQRLEILKYRMYEKSSAVALLKLLQANVPLNSNEKGFVFSPSPEKNKVRFYKAVKV